MSHVRKVLFTVVLAVLIAGPALACPTLSAHLPAFTNPTAPTPVGPSTPLRPLTPLAPLAGITVKDPGTIATKWSTRAGQAQTDYANGVQGASNAWRTNAAASEDAYAGGVQAAIAKKRYSAGITDVSAQKFAKNASTLGPARFAQGVQNAQGAYQTGVAPFLQTLSALTLPPRGPKGSAQNMNRAQVVAQALNAKRVGA